MPPGPPAPFVRFSRDKRGYEHVYLVHTGGGRGAPRARVLYWYRTPPGVKVGRQPFDDQVQKALEGRYPELRFDWPRIIEAQAPPLPEVEHWRERRRAERSAKQARTALSPERAPSTEPAPDEPEVSSTDLSLGESSATVASFVEPVAEPAEAGNPAESPVSIRGRQRRGGRRRRRGVRGSTTLPSEMAGQVDGPAGESPAVAARQADVAEAARVRPGDDDEAAESDSTS